VFERLNESIEIVLESVTAFGKNGGLILSERSKSVGKKWQAERRKPPDAGRSRRLTALGSPAPVIAF
jgi:hypothetical protein